MNSLSLTIMSIVLTVTLSSTVSQTWYSHCVARGTSYKCPGYLRTQKLDFPMCTGPADQYACYEDSQDTNSRWRRGKVTTPCNGRSRLGGCPFGFRRAVDKSSHCKDTIGGHTIRMTCTA